MFRFCYHYKLTKKKLPHYLHVMECLLIYNANRRFQKYGIFVSALAYIH